MSKYIVAVAFNQSNQSVMTPPLVKEVSGYSGNDTTLVLKCTDGSSIFINMNNILFYEIKEADND